MKEEEFIKELEKEAKMAKKFFESVENPNEITDEDKQIIQEIVYWSPDKMDRFLPYVRENKTNISKLAYLHWLDSEAEIEEYKLNM